MAGTSTAIWNYPCVVDRCRKVGGSAWPVRLWLALSTNLTEDKSWSLRYNSSGEIAMPRIGLTPEQRRLIEQAGDRPVRLEDPETNETYDF
jgi:hypothetical protein